MKIVYQFKKKKKKKNSAVTRYLNFIFSLFSDLLHERPPGSSIFK